MAIASRVTGDGGYENVEVLTELSGGYFLVARGWPSEPEIVHRCKLTPMSAEAERCLGVMSEPVLEDGLRRSV